MNISHLRYAVEVSKTGSVTKAAENMFIGQPNLSKALRELEEKIGITIFKRTSKGVVPTEKGEEFLVYAKRIISEITELEALYQTPKNDKQTFSISIPRSSCMAYALSNFVKKLDSEKEIEIHYKETNSVEAVSNLFMANYNLAVIRYRDIFEPYFSQLLKEKELKSEPLWEFKYQAVMSKNHKLANKETINSGDLADSTEILHGDDTVPSLPAVEAKRMKNMGDGGKRIYVFERGSQLELLSGVPDTFIWAPPIPEKLLNANNLVQRKVSGANYRGKDLLVYPRTYKLTKLDNMFIEELHGVIDSLDK